jgi:hypothetical protein
MSLEKKTREVSYIGLEGDIGFRKKGSKSPV